MRKQQVLDLVLGGNQRVEFSRLFVLDGFQQERHSPLAQQSTSFYPTEEGLKSLVAKKKDSLRKHSKNLILDDQKRRFETKPDQASVFMAMTSVHISSGLVLHQMMPDHNSSDLAPQRQRCLLIMVSSGPVSSRQKASDYDNSDPVAPRQNVVPNSRKVRFDTTRVRISLILYLEDYYNPTHGLAEENNMIKHSKCIVSRS
ncbi:hypothetical protein Tco_0014523 [Tanacetum coccineum]